MLSQSFFSPYSKKNVGDFALVRWAAVHLFAPRSSAVGKCPRINRETKVAGLLCELLTSTRRSARSDEYVSVELCPLLSGGRADFNYALPAAGVDVTQRPACAASPSPSPGTNTSFDLSCLEMPLVLALSPPCLSGAVFLAVALPGGQAWPCCMLFRSVLCRAAAQSARRKEASSPSNTMRNVWRSESVSISCFVLVTK